MDKEKKSKILKGITIFSISGVIVTIVTGIISYQLHPSRFIEGCWQFLGIIVIGCILAVRCWYDRAKLQKKIILKMRM